MELRRNASPAMMAAVSAASFHPIVLAYLDWPGGEIRAHSGVGPISLFDETWLGVGQFGQVQVGPESMSGLPIDFALSLVADLPELADYADAAIRQRPGALYLGATTTAGGNVLVGTPVSLATGTMDTMVLRLEFSQDVTLYQLSVGMRTGPGYRSSPAMTHSHEDQVGRYPTDTAGLMLRAALARAEKTLWPAP